MENLRRILKEHPDLRVLITSVSAQKYMIQYEYGNELGTIMRGHHQPLTFEDLDGAKNYLRRNGFTTMYLRHDNPHGEVLGHDNPDTGEVAEHHKNDGDMKIVVD